HVVAVSGIIAFNVIKTRQTSVLPPPAVNAEGTPKGTVASTPDSARPVERSGLVKNETGTREATKASDSAAKSAGTEQHRSEHPKPAEHTKVPPSSGKVYTVVKGDNPVKIARKLKISYEDLIALNHIEDPRKLRAGQKLLVPTKAQKSKTKVTTKKS